jgi:hypothetical protein
MVWFPGKFRVMKQETGNKSHRLTDYYKPLKWFSKPHTLSNPRLKSWATNEIQNQ